MSTGPAMSATVAWTLLSLAALGAAGCANVDPSPATAAAPSTPMTYERAASIAHAFHGDVCPADSVTTLACFSAGIDVAGGRLTFVSDNGDRSHVLPVAGLHAETGTRGLNLPVVRVDGTWELLITGDGGESAARLLADAMNHLPEGAFRLWADNALFPIILRAYRALPVKPEPGEDIRRLAVEAQDAVDRKQFADAAQLYGRINALAPWWPTGYFNAAYILGETGAFPLAARLMQRYLELVPDAPNARQMQDQIYVWQGRDRSPPAIDPQPDWFLTPPVPGQPHLGVVPVNLPPIVAAARHLPDAGALILYVVLGEPAAAAGLRAEDIVLSYAGRPVRTAADLAAAVRANPPPPGAALPVEIVRGDQRQTVTVRF